MANLYADSDFFITEVNYGDYGGVNAYNVAWTPIGGSARNFTVAANEPIQNVDSVGAATVIGRYEEVDWPSGNAYTTTVIASSSTTGSGSGITIQNTVSDNGTEDISIVAQGTGYVIDDEVVFPAAPLHRTSDLTVLIDDTDAKGVDYFPTGLTDADVVSNAVPLMKTEYGY